MHLGQYIKRNNAKKIIQVRIVDINIKIKPKKDRLKILKPLE